MPTEVIMPKVDMDMASGKIMSWHIAEGEFVAKGEPLFDIETDKAAMEIESPADGFLHHTASEGMQIPIGTPCAWLYAKGEEIGDQPKPFAGADDGKSEVIFDEPSGGRDVLEKGAVTDELPTQELSIEFYDVGKVRATPRARSLSTEEGLNIADVTGTGPRGRVQAKDIKDAIEARISKSAPSIAPAMFRPETGSLAVSRSKGGNGKPIVLIHGFASDSTSWAPLEASLRSQPLIRIDLPGHGKSPKLRIESFGDLVKEVRRVFDGLGIDSCHLVGHSLGGAVSLALADTRPKSLSSLTLISPAGLGPDINGAALHGICSANRAESLGPWLRSLVANEDIITDSYIRLAMSSRSEPNLRAAQMALADVMFPDGVQAFDLRAALNRLDVPTRIIWGKQDAIIPWKHALRAQGRVGLHLFEKIGHMPQIECGEEVALIMKSYL
ncbi:acetoin dehydrogenase dihydrolipoyllysine-residue acetyltransferase subunit [Marivita sp.]|uniref:acetoin dehydrogenase dihydrolipoyllysine-residue acetyltransferase subunit n=1 Tax=Marivita sp. TaxID=2003365 RepID=UPI003219053F